jgi:hypothetical protein
VTLTEVFHCSIVNRLGSMPRAPGELVTFATRSVKPSLLAALTRGIFPRNLDAALTPNSTQLKLKGKRRMRRPEKWFVSHFQHSIDHEAAALRRWINLESRTQTSRLV